MANDSQAGQRSTLPFAGIGWTAGGDKVDPTARQNSSSGILNIDNDLTAGGEFHVWFGTIWILSNTLETFFAIGYHNDAQTFNGGSANFGQITYDVVPTYRRGKFRFGAGIGYHSNVRYSLATTDTAGVISTQETEFEDTWGKIISLGYDFSDRGRVDLRYQFISYVVDKNGALPMNTKLDGNSVGLYFYITF